MPLPPPWPCNGSDLTRRLGFSQQEPDFKHATEDVVRPVLIRLRCPKTGTYARAPFVVSEEMGRRVARELGRSLA
jgi:hypothetical protein